MPSAPPLWPLANAGALTEKAKRSSASRKASLATVMATVPVESPAAMLSVPVNSTPVSVTVVAVVVKSARVMSLGVAVPSEMALADWLVMRALHGTSMPPVLVMALPSGPVRLTVKVTTAPSSTASLPAGVVRATVTPIRSLPVMVAVAVCRPRAARWRFTWRCRRWMMSCCSRRIRYTAMRASISCATTACKRKPCAGSGGWSRLPVTVMVPVMVCNSSSMAPTSSRVT